MKSIVPNAIGKSTGWILFLSAVQHVHGKAMIARVILGDKKFVNTENPRAIEKVYCINCGTKIGNLRSFKCQNGSYAAPALLKVIKEMERKEM